jgi:uncharacterized protein YecT (DUF1311 family)
MMLLLLTFAATAISAASGEIKPDCNGDTPEMNACMLEKVDRAEKRLQTYLQKAIERHTDDSGKFDAVALGIQASQTAFEAYREIECNSVLEDFKDGTIRGIMTLGCRLSLTNERTHTVWNNWLQYMDSTPPLLPDPKPIE